MRDIIEVYRKIGGFQALHVAEAYDVLKEAVEKADLRFLSFTGNLVATGVREIIADAIRRRLFNMVITTAGALDHDIAKSMGARYVPGSFDLDDADLASRGLHRLGNVVIRREEYGPLIEKFVLRHCEELWGRVLATYELAEILGKSLPEDSILGAAARAGVKVFVPGIVDGAVGTALLTCNDLARTRRGATKLLVDVLKDEEELRELVYNSDKLAALIVGGGISKHHVIWWAQFRGGLDYVVYISTAVEYDGSLSGARPREAVSWGKVKPTARSVYIFADATLVLPVLLKAL
ncbi:MAG: deoxyhypusine synthase [Pyrobaculum arsenaticum]|uniref:deoxyhypusine synthase n=1 Tax=Pyrobaculum arsenaticum TaxID=121277 RepID=UPI0022749BEF|nr:deoxyhypusine synthase [Pyrobaculum arsenaticum]